MSLAPGTRLGAYEIVAPLGAGGMGEVYRAKDTRLGREVAVKVLPEHLSANADVRARFEREARLISSLNHPNICTLFDVGREGEVDFLVMELIEGETLAARLARAGALPGPEVLRLGAQVADALERAHRAGVVHRDLKPANVMLMKSGAKLMDFGLARATDAGGPTSASGATMAALTRPVGQGSPLTAEGTLLGTFQYMAPEQLEGRDIDARADIWALGCVLYEMATGKRAFEGRSQASLISAIMTSEPAPVSQVAPLAPPGLDRLVRTCLTKDVDERARTAHDIKLQLQGLMESGSQAQPASGVTAAPTPTPPRRAGAPGWLPWAVAGVCALAAAAALMAAFRPRAATTSTGLYAAIEPPPGAEFSSSYANPRPLTISRDGRRIAFCARHGQGPDQLWVRELDSPDARALAGTEGAEQPFFAPDGSALGFFSYGKLRRVSVAGGPVTAIADASDPRGGSWGDGVIVFAPVSRSGIYRVSPDGGVASAVTALDTTLNESTHRYPQFLPDGKRFLYLARRAGAGSGEQPIIYVAGLDARARTRVISVASNVACGAGQLLFGQGGTLMAQPFDAGRAVTTGTAVPVATNLQWDQRFSRGVFAASDQGVLVYRTGVASTRAQLCWVDRAGRRLANVGEPADYTYGGTPNLSPDGTQAAMPILDGERGISDVWIVDIASGRRRRLTLDDQDHATCAWWPDGRQILYNESTGLRATKMVLTPLEGTGTRRLETGLVEPVPYGSSPDGRYVLLSIESPVTLPDIYALPLSGGPAVPVANGPGSEASPGFSPDGRFVAYASNESGRPQVYVVAFPANGGKWQVSQEGGTEPRWSRDGKELFYVDRENWIVSVELGASAAGFAPGATHRLFQFHSIGGDWRYDVSPDGTRFLVAAPPDDATQDPITLVTNWTARLAKPGSQ